MTLRAHLTLALLGAALLTGCGDGSGGSAGSARILDVSAFPEPRLIQTVEGFDGPESVYYDGGQDVWFVSSQ